jgi:hypothetical protein
MTVRQELRRGRESRPAQQPHASDRGGDVASAMTVRQELRRGRESREWRNGKCGLSTQHCANHSATFIKKTHTPRMLELVFFSMWSRRENTMQLRDHARGITVRAHFPTRGPTAHRTDGSPSCHSRCDDTLLLHSRVPLTSRCDHTSGITARANFLRTQVIHIHTAHPR